MIEFGHATHTGLRREHNEDTYWADHGLGLWLVADGMGGHQLGEVASAIARDAVVAGVASGQDLAAAMRGANDAILAWPHRQGAMLPMGTTLAALRIDDDDQFTLASVGDSRVYLWFRGTLQQMSRDDSAVQDLLEQGAITREQAHEHPQRNQITQALGITAPESLRIEPVAGRCTPGMQFLLCSDGLTEHLDDARLAATVARTELAAQECVDQLVLAALDAGGHDNITALLVRIG